MYRLLIIGKMPETDRTRGSPHENKSFHKDLDERRSILNKMSHASDPTPSHSELVVYAIRVVDRKRGLGKDFGFSLRRRLR